MNYFATLALLLLCVLLLRHLSQRRNAWRQADALWPYRAKRPLSSPQQVLYQRLVLAMPGYIVLSRVPVASVLGVKPGFDLAAWTQRLRHLHYDYVVCAKDASVLAAIELADNLRSGKGPTIAELTKERATVAAGVRLLRWQAGALPDQAEIQTALGGPVTPYFEEPTSSVNESWWPPASSARQDSAPE